MKKIIGKYGINAVRNKVININRQKLNNNVENKIIYDSDYEYLTIKLIYAGFSVIVMYMCVTNDRLVVRDEHKHY